MMFVIEGIDGKDAGALREQHRDAHVAHLLALGERFVLGGPFLDDSGNQIGSLMVIEAEDRAAANAFAGADPFVIEGVFEKVTVRRWAFGHLRAGGKG
jgi:uncharacterized protein YciI